MWKVFLGNSNGKDVAINQADGEDRGLVVATRPHKTVTSKTAFAVNDDYGREMNQNAAFGGSVLIADGDSTPWTFAESGTKYTEDSTDRFYDTAKSIKADNAVIGEYMEFTNQAGGAGTNIDMTGYVGFSMWINIDKDWKTDSEVFFQCVVGGSLVGNSVDLSDYFDWADHDTWHYVTVLKADLGVSTTEIDAVRFTQGAKGGAKAPKYYVDLLNLQETGAPISYSIKPSSGTWFHIQTVHITMADAYTGIVTVAGATENASLPNLSYNKFLGMTGAQGLKLEGYRDNALVPGTGSQVTNIGDMMSLPTTKITNAISDGTNTCISLERHFTHPIVIKAEENDELRVTIQDDFSVLLMMRFSCMGYVETR